MHTATIKHYDYFGIAMTTACALSVGDVGSGILNPVTSVALAVVKNRNVGDLWVYLIGDISGTLAACVMWYVWWPSPEKVDHNNDLPYSRYFSNDEALWVVVGNDSKTSGLCLRNRRERGVYCKLLYCTT